MDYNVKPKIKKQGGLALITVLFIFVLVTMLATSILNRGQRDISQSAATYENTQAYLLAISAEELAKAGLAFDAQRDKKSNEPWDTSAELWNQVFATQIEGYNVKISIRDLQGLFNLNSLHPSAPSPQDGLARFQRLLGSLALDTSIATNLKEWFTEGSAANYEYNTFEPSYSASEIEMTHPSELLLVKGVTPEAYRTIEPYITTLPATTLTNINTVLPEVIETWDAGLTLDDAKSLTSKTRPGVCAQQRATAVYKTVDEWFEATPISSLSDTSKNPDSPWKKGDFDTKTEYFSVFVTLEYNERVVVLESIIKRDLTENFIGTIYRDFSRAPGADDTLVKTMNCGTQA